MDAMCDIPDDVRRELDLVHADVGTYINLDNMRTLSYASLDYLAILDTLARNIPHYNFNFLRVPTPLGECAITSNLGTVLAHSDRVDVVKYDFHAFFVHLIDDEKHVIRMEEDKRSFDDGHAIQAIIVQLWSVVVHCCPKPKGCNDGKVIAITPQNLFIRFEYILKKHAEVVVGLRRQLGLVPICRHIDPSGGPIVYNSCFRCGDCVRENNNAHC